MSIREIILDAGEILKKRYFEDTVHNVKERYHLLSEADNEINGYFIEKISKEFPKYSIYSEESEEIVNDQSKRWIIDPIDGTTNFLTGNPYFAVSIALEIDEEIVEGHVYNPVTNEYFFGSKEGMVAIFNGQRINVSTSNEIKNSIIAFGYSTNIKIINEYYKHWKPLFEKCKKGTPWIAPALSICNVARGKVDAFIDTGSSMEGQAAASLILKNAGGKLYDPGFNDYTYRSKGGIFCSESISYNLKMAYKSE